MQTVNAPLDDIDMAEVAAIFADQEDRGRIINGAEQAEIIETIVQRSADMQFRGQTHLIRVALPQQALTRDAVQSLFERAYLQRFEIQMPEIKAQLVNLNTSVIGRRRPFPIARLLDPSARATSLAAAITGRRKLYADESWHDAAIYARERLPLGAAITGPAVIEQIDATTVIEPNAMAITDSVGNLRIKVQA